MAADPQELVDDLAEALGRPVALDDRDWRLLAASAYLSEDDAVRRHSLLARTTAEDVVAWLRTLGLQHETSLLETPENAELGMRARVVAPVRHEQVTLAYLWVIAGDTPLDAAEREDLEAAAEDAARILWDRRAHNLEEQQRQAELLAALLDAPDPEERARAAAALAERRNWSDSPSFALALGRLGVPEVASDVGDRTRRRWHAADLIWRAKGTEITALARLASGQTARDVAAGLQRAGAKCAAALEVPALEQAGAVATTVGDGLFVLERLPGLGPAASVADLGAWPEVARLWNASGRPSRPQLLEPLLDHRAGAELIEALEATLDAAGDVAGAARQIHVHRSTLYRRLETAQELTGLSLDRGDDRLRAHLALRMWRLASTTGP